MKRYTVVKHFIDLLDDNDILIFSGDDLCREAHQSYKDNHFYIKDSIGLATSFGLGLAMCTDKRVFIFIGEGELLRELGIIAQIGASKCSNLFLVLLDNACYQSSGNYPNIFENMLSKKGFIYNSNTKVITFTKHFKNKEFKRLKDRFTRLMGPMVILMDVDKGIKKNISNFNINFEAQKNRIFKLVTDVEKETAMFVPPILPGPIDEPKILNLDEINTGGIT